MKTWMICMLMAAVGLVASIVLTRYALDLADAGSFMAFAFAAVGLGFFGGAVLFTVSAVRSLVLALR